MKTATPKLLPRETGKDIGMGSPVPLSQELVGVITRLRNMKDENEDWSRWRDVVFRGQKLTINSVNIKDHLPAKPNGYDNSDNGMDLVATGFKPSPTREESVDPDPSSWIAQTDTGTLYCKECFLPLHPDPSPEDLYIYLHAFRYTTECLGSFETNMPHWAEKGWKSGATVQKP
jgi:hypothetical protein